MCGIFGMFGTKDAAVLTSLGLYALQHRGEESAGIVSYNKRNIRQKKGMGLAGDMFDSKALRSLCGNVAVGHTRYSTTGASVVKNIQPFVVKHKKTNIAIAHNGNLTNTRELRRELEEKGSIFQTTMDSEIIAHLLVRSKGKNLKEKVAESLAQLKGAYSLVLMIDGTLIGARDPYGFRPLCIGKLDGSYVLASETCALDLINAKYVRDVNPGEIVLINNSGLKRINIPNKVDRHAFCIFEYIYFSRPDSDIFENNVYLARKELGRQLAKEHPANKCDFVMPIPDSGNYAAMGYAEESGIPLEVGMIRNHYIGRTFIQPSQHLRDFRVRVKLNPIKNILKGKKIAIVEDSIVRGTTSRSRVRTLRKAGAKEIHMRISCPPIIAPCYYGIDFPTTKELIASNNTVEKIRKFVGLDSLKYLSVDGMLKSMPLAGSEFCTACFTKKYPTKLPRRFSKYMLEGKK